MALNRTFIAVLGFNLYIVQCIFIFFNFSTPAFRTIQQDRKSEKDTSEQKVSTYTMTHDTSVLCRLKQMYCSTALRITN